MKPTVDEVRAAIEEKGYTHVDAEEFWSYWESVDWKRGRVPIRNWKAALMNRERQLVLRGERQQPQRYDPGKSDYIPSPDEQAAIAQARERFCTAFSTDELPENTMLIDHERRVIHIPTTTR